MKNSRVRRRKEILKIRAEINVKETKETVAKINKAKSWFFERLNKINKEMQTLNDTIDQLDLMISIGHFTPKQ